MDCTNSGPLSEPQVGHDLLELAVFFFELAQPAPLRGAHTRVLLGPHLFDTGVQLRLLQRKAIRALVTLLLHDMLLARCGPSSCRSFCYRTVQSLLCRSCQMSTNRVHAAMRSPADVPAVPELLATSWSIAAS